MMLLDANVLLYQAALAIEHGLTICSADTDFARFPAAGRFDPLVP